jgi:hypothetical protein
MLRPNIKMLGWKIQDDLDLIHRGASNILNPNLACVDDYWRLKILEVKGVLMRYCPRDFTPGCKESNERPSDRRKHGS